MTLLILRRLKLSVVVLGGRRCRCRICGLLVNCIGLCILSVRLITLWSGVSAPGMLCFLFRLFLLYLLLEFDTCCSVSSVSVSSILTGVLIVICVELALELECTLADSCWIMSAACDTDRLSLSHCDGSGSNATHD